MPGAGGEAAFRARPFLSLNINHAVPPLRFHGTSAEVLAEALRHGIPVQCNVFDQLGASSPVTLAGSVAQTLAETLAALALVHALAPGAPAIAGPRPMITDLRTGGFSGEQALATAMCCQVLRHWDLPCSAIAGATDAKLPDAQAGYEKALTVNTALQAGLMGVSFPAMVIDNDMLGAILRANVPPRSDGGDLGARRHPPGDPGRGAFPRPTRDPCADEIRFPLSRPRRPAPDRGLGARQHTA